MISLPVVTLVIEKSKKTNIDHLKKLLDEYSQYVEKKIQNLKEEKQNCIQIYMHKSETIR